MFHIRQICVEDNGRVSCINVSDHFEINKVKDEKNVEHVNRFMKSGIAADFNMEAVLTIKIKHEDASATYELLKESEKEQEPDEQLKDLTPREFEVLHLLGEGCTAKEIALALNIELTTVKTHTHKIYEKLNLHNRAKIIFLTKDRK